MTISELKTDLEKWLKVWEDDLTDRPEYLEMVSSKIDYLRKAIKEAQDES